MPNPEEIPRYSAKFHSAIAWVDPDLLEALSSVGASVVNLQDLKQDSFENKIPLYILNSSAAMYECM